MHITGRNRRDEEQGSVIILIAITMVAMLGFLGIVVDYGRDVQERWNTQSAADTAALQAAYDIYSGDSESTATTAANNLMTRYGYSSSSLSLSYLNSTGSTTGTASSVSNVQASVSSTIPTYIMGVLGIHSMNVSSAGTAKVSVQAPGCVICILSSNFSSINGNNALDLTNQGSIDISGGTVADDWTTPSSIALTNSGGIYVSGGGSIETMGGVSGPANQLSPTPVTITTPVPDPLANVPVPTCATGNPEGTGTENYSGSTTLNLQPGTYDTISDAGSGNINLAPGVYCITQTLQSSNAGNITGSGVTLYFTCGSYPTASACSSSGANGGKMSFSNSGSFECTADTSGPQENIVVFFDRNNTNTIALTNSGSANFNGTIYAKSATMTLTNAGGVSQMDSIIVVANLKLTNQGTIDDAYTPTDNYPDGVPGLSS